MYRSNDLHGLVAAAVTVAAVFVVSLILEIVDRVTASPAMRRRVNDGTDKFLAERGTIWQVASRATSQFLSRFTRRGFWDP